MVDRRLRALRLGGDVGRQGAQGGPFPGYCPGSARATPGRSHKATLDLSEWKAANRFGTLTAAHAEAGDFAKAVEDQEKAHQLDSDDGKKPWGKLLDVYRQKKPYQEDE